MLVGQNVLLNHKTHRGKILFWSAQEEAQINLRMYFYIHGLVRSTEATLSDFIMKDGGGGLRGIKKAAEQRCTWQRGGAAVHWEPIVAHSAAASA